jgi:cobalt-zinc-cadmium efflux system outer membrane protein
MLSWMTRWIAWACLLLLGGCCTPMHDQLAHLFCGRPLDQSTPRVTIRLAADEDPRLPEPQGATGLQLTIPPGLPGAEGLAELRRLGQVESAEERRQAVARLFPPLPAIGNLPEPAPGPGGHPLTLSDLQRLANTNSPLLAQAAADVASARGQAVQAGLYPNPTVGYEGDNINSGSTAGFQGAVLEQTIKTPGKLSLARQVAEINVRNAELAYRQTAADVAAAVRHQYFAVLVALENRRVARALLRLTEELYNIQRNQLLLGGQVAAYEPMQLRVFIYQTRNVLAQAHTRYTSAWKQLAAVLGLPGLHPTQLAGQADMPVPVFCYEGVLARMLSHHTDVRTAENLVLRDQLALKLARLNAVPDLNVAAVVQKDYTTPPFNPACNVRVTVPVPLFDRNQGNRQSAEAALAHSQEEAHRVRADLTQRLAEAFERYQNARVQLEFYRDHILPDQVRTLDGVYRQHNIKPEAATFGDIVTAQQMLGTAIVTYLSTLAQVWTAVVDVAHLLQTDDLYLGASETCQAALPDLEHLRPLPCCHPNSPLPNAHQPPPDPRWPNPLPELPAREPATTDRKE